MENDLKKGRVGCIRQVSLRQEKVLAAELHGKRLDDTSQLRKVRADNPIVYGSLDLRETLEAHMSGVVRTKGAKTACVHAYVQFPTSLINANDYKEQYRMLMNAVKFINDFHGGSAVFAARLDRDESGQHGVDVFFMPRYENTYKDGRTIIKASASKFSKERARERYCKLNKVTKEPELDKYGKVKRLDDVRSQGRALQAAWFEYLRDEMQLTGVLPPTKKLLSTQDRLEPEEYKLQQEREKFEEEKRAHYEALRLQREQEQAVLAASSLAVRRASQALHDGIAAVDEGQLCYDPVNNGLLVREVKKPVISDMKAWSQNIGQFLGSVVKYARSIKKLGDYMAGARVREQQLEAQSEQIKQRSKKLRDQIGEAAPILLALEQRAAKKENPSDMKEIAQQRERFKVLRKDIER